MGKVSAASSPAKRVIEQPRKVLVLVGPTASGKTDVALRLAQLLPVEIISADSRQIYKYLDIGTAKPTPEQLRLVKHHFVSAFSPDHEFSAGEFGAKGRKVIDAIFARGRTPLVVGGSGLYIQALIDGFFEGPGADKEFRDRLNRRVAAGELPKLVEELRAVDPATASRIDPHNARRLIRALEVFHLTGKPMSQVHRHHAVTISFLPKLFGLAWDRSQLYRRIEQRCDAMLQAGLLKEVEELERRKLTPTLNALNTVGYEEAFAYRRGELSYDEMVRLFKQNSRRYAKRQLTWFRRDTRIQWIAMDEHTNPATVAQQIYRAFTTDDC
ncbi:MAG: tRNA (adenosine(37)-N6)-dimethylallyltransferase MiaA [Ignavibacteria bacterium]